MNMIVSPATSWLRTLVMFSGWAWQMFEETGGSGEPPHEISAQTVINANQDLCGSGRCFLGSFRRHPPRLAGGDQGDDWDEVWTRSGLPNRALAHARRVCTPITAVTAV